MNTARHPLPVLLLVSALAATSCKKDGGVPAYLQLQPITMTTVQGEGTDRHRITEVWAYANDQLLGVWEAEGRIPVLAEGPTDIKMIAGVRRNGVLNDRIQYPFLATYGTEADLGPELTTPVAPVFSYFPDLVFWIEDFDGNGFQFEREADSDTLLYVWDTIQNPVSEIYEGRASGAFFVDAQRPYFSYVYDGDAFDVDVSDPCWMEVHYRSDMRFLVGVYVTSSGGPVERIPYLYVSPTKREDGSMPWNKIYIDLQSAWPFTGVTDRKFYIEASLPSGQSTGTVYLDNIKVIHR
jgi:hypothetical protein